MKIKVCTECDREFDVSTRGAGNAKTCSVECGETRKVRIARHNSREYSRKARKDPEMRVILNARTKAYYDKNIRGNREYYNRENAKDRAKRMEKKIAIRERDGIFVLPLMWPVGELEYLEEVQIDHVIPNRTLKRMDCPFKVRDGLDNLQLLTSARNKTKGVLRLSTWLKNNGKREDAVRLALINEDRALQWLRSQWNPNLNFSDFFTENEE